MANLLTALYLYLCGDRLRSRAVTAYIGSVFVKPVLEGNCRWCGLDIFRKTVPMRYTLWPKKNFLSSNLDLLTEIYILCSLRLYALSDS